MAGSSDLCAHLQPGERVVLMGRRGSDTYPHGEVPRRAVWAAAWATRCVYDRRRDARSRHAVVYFAGYKKTIQDRYKVAEIERAADVIVWCCDEAPGFAPTRPQDRTFVGNICQAMAA